jgi:hypothetical protein
MCNTGDLQACDVMYRYELARSGRPVVPLPVEIDAAGAVD